MSVMNIYNIKSSISQWEGSHRVLFPKEPHSFLKDTAYYKWLQYASKVMHYISKNLETTDHFFPIFTEVTSIHEEDPIDVLNCFYEYSAAKPLNAWMDPCIVEMLIQRKLLPFTDDDQIEEEELAFYLKHAKQWSSHFIAIIHTFLNEQMPAIEVSRLHPKLKKYLTSAHCLFVEENLNAQDVVKIAKIYDPFALERSYQWRDGVFTAVQLHSIRPISEFYGYESLRAFFKNYFYRFIQGENYVPLLMTSLPGLGKTHLTISNILAHDNLTLILGAPETLTHDLPQLFAKLAARPYRKFVIFIDDIDTRNVDWYTFRTYVGGSYTLPKNVTLAIASNFPFPPNVLNRGQNCLFPLFDPSRCNEMIHDFLCSMGMKKPPERLVMVIAANYTEEVGQKIYEDLSPRTLIRYLELFRADPEKRKRMLELSLSNVSTRPDPDLFFESNIQRLRALYGESAIDELRHEVMKSYGLTS